MSPLGIQILLHYACCTDDFRGGDHSAPAVREALDRFTQHDDLLNAWPAQAQWTARYSLTARGRVFVDALQALPLPVSVWVMPTVEKA